MSTNECYLNERLHKYIFMGSLLCALWKTSFNSTVQVLEKKHLPCQFLAQTMVRSHDGEMLEYSNK